MNCIYPRCGLPTQVLTIRKLEPNVTTRRRECPKQHRFTTVEVVKPPHIKKTAQPLEKLR